jgi:hypothetical protein
MAKDEGSRTRCSGSRYGNLKRKTGLRRPGSRTKGAEQGIQDQGMVTKRRKTGLMMPGPRTKGARQGVQDQGMVTKRRKTGLRRPGQRTKRA